MSEIGTVSFQYRVMGLTKVDIIVNSIDPAPQASKTLYVCCE